jgi:hypothetical protein
MPQGSNPFAHGLNINVFVPEVMEIRMVDASTLEDYEMWLFLASILSGAVIAFAVAFAQDTTQHHLLAMAIVFVALFGGAASMAVRKRLRLRNRSRTIRLRAIEAAREELG